VSVPASPCIMSAVADLIRTLHPQGFRRGEWAALRGTVTDPEYGRDCYIVEFADGTADFWLTDVPAGRYEFASGEPPAPTRPPVRGRGIPPAVRRTYGVIVTVSGAAMFLMAGTSRLAWYTGGLIPAGAFGFWYGLGLVTGRDR
jgi:hypothetical protein